MKNVALALGLSENATEEAINAKAAEMNLEVVEGKLVNKKAKNEDEDDDDEDEGDKAKNTSNDDKYATKADHKKLSDRVSKMEDAFKKMKNSQSEDKVNNKINSLVTAGKIENKAETISKVKEKLEKDFEGFSEIYDMLPSTVVKGVKKPVSFNTLIENAAKAEGSASKAEAEKTKAEIDSEIEANEIEQNKDGYEIIREENTNRPIVNTGKAVVDGKIVVAPKIKLRDAFAELKEESKK